MISSTDIGTRADIEKVIRLFYEKVRADDTIGFIFNEVVEMDWEHHIPVIVDFWETILLDRPVYQRNAMAVHHQLHAKVALLPAFFERWLALFHATVDENFQGRTADLAKKRATAIGSLMQHKFQGAGH